MKFLGSWMFFLTSCFLSATVALFMAWARPAQAQRSHLVLDVAGDLAWGYLTQERPGRQTPLDPDGDWCGARRLHR